MGKRDIREPNRSGEYTWNADCLGDMELKSRERERERMHAYMCVCVWFLGYDYEQNNNKHTFHPRIMLKLEAEVALNIGQCRAIAH